MQVSIQYRRSAEDRTFLQGDNNYMGGPEGQAMLNGFIPNGLLPNESTSVNRVLDPKRWSRVEERTTELITHIQPNESSEGCRNAVASYVQRLIRKCFSCQVFTFGSVPLKTYLPDGDIDLTVFSNNQTLMDSWPDEVCNILESEEGCEDAEFCVKEVHYIQAEVKIIKCIVENIVVDISFNQLGGLCTLCFLEEVDVLISQDHLFKRSIILIKAWCYYESRILGAHHGLISTYALETLVLYIFHIYNNKFSGPLEVLYRFLEFFSKFDWNNYCLSLWGPVPISSLPDMRAEPPRMDCGELLLSKAFLDSCGSVYTAMPSSQGQPRQGQPFVSKYFNIIDPLRANNNLGRSVSKGNFFRIKSAFAFGAQQLVQLLDCPEENLIAEFNLFFRNTWDRHGKGHRPDAPNYDIGSRYKIVTENSKCHEFKVEGAHTSHAVKTERGNGHSSSSKVDSSKKLSLRSKFSNHSSSSKNGNSKKLSLRSKASNNHSGKVSAKNQQSSWHTSSNWRSDYAHDSEDASNSYDGEFGLGIIEEDGLSVEKAMWIYQEEQDFVNGMTTWGNPNFISSVQEEQDFVNGMTTWGNPNFISYVQAPVIANSTNMSFHVLPPILASGYTHANSFGMLPANVSFESFWGHNMTSNQEDLSESMGENLVVAELCHEDGNGDEWPELNVNSVRGCGYEDGGIQAQQQRDKKELASVGYSSSYSSSQTSSVNYSSKDYGVTIENRWLTRENYGKDPLDERSIEIDENSTSDSLTTTSEDQILTWDQRQLKKAYPAKAPAVHARQYKGKLVDTISSQPDSQPTVGTDLIESMGSESVASDVQTRQSTRYEAGPMTKSSSNVPATLVFIGPDSAQRMLDEQGLIPVRFYSTGLPVPFLPMLPLHNVPASARTSYAATYPVDSDAELGNYHAGQFNVNLDSAWSPKLSDTLNKPNHIGHDAKLECVEKQKFDIFKGNFATHWENLQYGRLCQNLEFQELLPYPPSSIVPLMYLQEQYPWDGYGEAPTNMNLMTHVPHLIPMVPVQIGSDSPTGINRHFAGELPTFRGGTGTYFPSPTSYEKFFRQRKYANYRNDRGNHSHDRRDHHGEKERNRNFYSKPRFSGHKHYRYHQVYRPRIRMDRTDLVVGASEISPSETASPPLASLYPYDPNISYTSSNLPEFGSFEPVHVSHTSKALHRGESSHSVVDEQANLEGYSPDSSNYPSSPNF